MGRSFASRVSSPRLKWVILVFWLVLVAAAAPLASKLTAEQNNEISSWLPGDAESTLALVWLESTSAALVNVPVLVTSHPAGTVRATS